MIHLPFENRREAGHSLAAELRAREIPHDSVVLALTRGGVSVGAEIADDLHLPLDVVVVRKIGVPWQPELAMGALAGNVRVLNEPLIVELNISANELRQAISREQSEAHRREQIYRSGSPRVDLRDKTAIIVDDGLATGNTTLAAIRQIKTRNPSRTILAVPVASRNGLRLVRPEVDDIVCLAVPERFVAVSEWYLDFPQLSDEEVTSIVARFRVPA